MKVVVTGIGLISALGKTLKTTWERLLLSQVGIEWSQPYLELNGQPLALISNHPSNLNDLLQQVVAAAVEDANLTLPLSDCGVVIGSSRGYQAQWEELARHYCQFNNCAVRADGYGSDALNIAAIIYEQFPAILAARQLGSNGPVLAPMAACSTGIWAIAQGFELLQTGQCQQVIVGAVETPITPLTLAGFAKMGALAQTGAYPFDYRREGFCLAEGAAVFVLETASLASERTAKVYGQISGFGLTTDGYHVTTPAPDHQSAIAAVQKCLKYSGLSTDAVDYIHAHGTGTQLNDQAEAHLIQTLFPAGVPVSSTKGATGHTLGASGALGTAFCLMALQEQMLPPCVGLKQPAFELDLVTIPRPSKVRSALCFSFGFGGQNAILALSRDDHF